MDSQIILSPPNFNFPLSLSLPLPLPHFVQKPLHQVNHNNNYIENNNNNNNSYIDKELNYINNHNNISNSVIGLNKSLNREESQSSITPFSTSSSYSDFSNISSNGTNNSEVISMGTIYTGDNGGVVVDFSGRDLSKCPTKLPCEKDKVESVVCSNNRISSIPEDYFQNFQFLTAINLENNRIKKLPKSFKKLQSLQILRLGSNKIKKFPKSILQISTIQYLDLSDNKIVSIPKEISLMVNLKELLLPNNEIHIIPIQITELNLYILDLFGNPMVLPPIEVVELGIEAIVEYLLDDANSRAIKTLVSMETQRQKHHSLPVGLFPIKPITIEDLSGADSYIQPNSNNIPFLRKSTMFLPTQPTHMPISSNLPPLPKRTNTEYSHLKLPSKPNEKLFNSTGNSVVIQASPTAITNTYYTPKKSNKARSKNSRLSLGESTRSMMDLQFEGRNGTISPPLNSTPPPTSLPLPIPTAVASAPTSPSASVTTSPRRNVIERESSPVISPRWSSVSSLVLGNSFIDQQKRDEKQLAKKEKADIKKKKRDDEKREKKEKKAEKKREQKQKKEEFTCTRRHTISTPTEIPIIEPLSMPPVPTSHTEPTITEAVSYSESFNSNTAYDSGTMTSTSSSTVGQQQMAEENSQLSDMSSNSNVSSPPLSPNLTSSSTSNGTVEKQPQLKTQSHTQLPQVERPVSPPPNPIYKNLSQSALNVSKLKSPQRQHVLQKVATVLNLRPLSIHIKSFASSSNLSVNNVHSKTSCESNGETQSSIKNDESVSDVFDNIKNRKARRGTIGSDMDLKYLLKVFSSKSFPPLAEILQDPDGRECLRAFLTTEFSVENLDCWIRIENYKALNSYSKTKECIKIYNQFIVEGSIQQVNLPSGCVRKIEESINGPNETISNLETIFNDTQQHIFILMETDSYERFKKSSYSLKYSHFKS